MKILSDNLLLNCFHFLPLMLENWVKCDKWLLLIMQVLFGSVDNDLYHNDIGDNYPIDRDTAACLLQ